MKETTTAEIDPAVIHLQVVQYVADARILIAQTHLALKPAVAEYCAMYTVRTIDSRAP